MFCWMMYVASRSNSNKGFAEPNKHVVEDMSIFSHMTVEVLVNWRDTIATSDHYSNT